MSTQAVRVLEHFCLPVMVGVQLCVWEGGGSVWWRDVLTSIVPGCRVRSHRFVAEMIWGCDLDRSGGGGV